MAGIYLKVAKIKMRGKVIDPEKDGLSESFQFLQIPKIIVADNSSYRLSVTEENLQYEGVGGFPSNVIDKFFSLNVKALNSKSWDTDNVPEGADKFSTFCTIPIAGDYVEFQGKNRPRIEVTDVKCNGGVLSAEAYITRVTVYWKLVSTVNEKEVVLSTSYSTLSGPSLNTNNDSEFTWPNVTGAVSHINGGMKGFSTGISLFNIITSVEFNSVADIQAHIKEQSGTYIDLGLRTLQRFTSGDTVSENQQLFNKEVINSNEGTPGVGEKFSAPTIREYPDPANGEAFKTARGYNYILSGNIYTIGANFNDYSTLWCGGSNLGANTVFKLNNVPKNAAEAFFEGMVDYEPPVEPGHGPTSTPGGGSGNFDGSSDSVDIPDLPSISALSSGFISTYSPTTSELQSLAGKLWTKDFTDQIEKLWNSPMEGVISLQISFAPFATGAKREMKIGNYNSGISSAVVNSQFTTLDCGSINLKEYWGNFLDYAPNTELSIYLPFIGTRRLDVNNVMDGTLRVVYNIDVLNGTCVANLMIEKNGLKSVIYTFSGNCNIQVPISNSSWGPAYSTAISMLTSVVQGGASIIAGAASGNPVSASAGAGLGVGMVASTADSITKPMSSVATNGTIGSSAGALSVRYPYLILNRPIQSLAKSYASESGFPSNITSKLSALNGYTKVLNIHLDGVKATETEKDELLSLLRAGVVL